MTPEPRWQASTVLTFAIHFDDSASASDAAQDVRQRGFDVQLQRQRGSRSTVLAASTDELRGLTLDEALSLFDAVAVTHGGSFIGHGGMSALGLDGTDSAR